MAYTHSSLTSLPSTVSLIIGAVSAALLEVEEMALRALAGAELTLLNCVLCVLFIALLSIFGFLVVAANKERRLIGWHQQRQILAMTIKIKGNHV